MTPFVAVVGTVNKDVILSPGGRREESLGGILYNVVPLATLLDGVVVVRPIGRLGREDRREAVRILGAFPNVDADGLIEDPAGTNLSILDYSGGSERIETVEMRVAPLSASDLAPARGAQATLVNMISGRDVASATLAELRRGERGSFLLDVQALARSTDTPRRPRVVPDAPAWCRVFDVVRGSETEIAHFGGAPGDPRSAAARILSAGAGEVLATRGERGSVRYVLAGGELQRAEVAAVPCRAPVDPTGCGDSFLSGVCAGRILGLSALESLRLGSFVASRVLALAGLEALAALRTIRREALDYEPAWSSVFAEGPGARRPPPGSR